MTKADPKPLASGIAATALGVLLVGSALAVGTVHYQTLLCVAGFAVVSTSIVMLLAPSQVRRLPSPALVLLALAAWSALQAVPIPMSILSRVAPHNADVWARALRPF